MYLWTALFVSSERKATHTIYGQRTWSLFAQPCYQLLVEQDSAGYTVFVHRMIWNGKAWVRDEQPHNHHGEIAESGLCEWLSHYGIPLNEWNPVEPGENV